MFPSTRSIIRSKSLLKFDCFKGENVALIHVCATRQWSVLAKKLPPTHQLRNNALRLPCMRYLSSNTTVTNQQDTITVYSPGKQASSTSGSIADKSNLPDVTTNVVSTSSNEAMEHVAKVAATSLPPIPEPPKPPILAELLGGEPSFESLGLSGWSPVGLLQQTFEYFHITMGLPWWECIVVGTLAVRTLMTPFVIISQRNSRQMENNMPEMQAIQKKISDAKNRGEVMEAAQHSQELMIFMREKNLNPLKNMLIPLIQAPVFLSFFISLRQMANLPVKSLHEGGLFWFTDLTVPDQYYILPLMTCLTLAAAIEIGADGKVTGNNVQLTKAIMRGIPIVIFPFIMNFPGALLLYWLSTNSFSLLQVGLLRYSPFLRRLCKIPDPRKIDKSKLNEQKKPMITAIKDWWKETRNTSKIQARGDTDHSSFLAAGRSSIKKTYKYNPTLPRSPAASVHTKKTL